MAPTNDVDEEPMLLRKKAATGHDDTRANMPTGELAGFVSNEVTPPVRYPRGRGLALPGGHGNRHDPRPVGRPTRAAAQCCLPTTARRGCRSGPCAVGPWRRGRRTPTGTASTCGPCQRSATCCSRRGSCASSVRPSRSTGKAPATPSRRQAAVAPSTCPSFGGGATPTPGVPAAEPSERVVVHPA